MERTGTKNANYHSNQRSVTLLCHHHLAATHNKQPITALHYSTGSTTRNDTANHLNVIAPPTTCRQLIREEQKNYRNLRILVENARRKFWSFPIGGTNRSETASESTTWRVSVGTIYLLLSVGRTGGRAVWLLLLRCSDSADITHNTTENKLWARRDFGGCGWNVAHSQFLYYHHLSFPSAKDTSLNARQKPVSEPT